MSLIHQIRMFSNNHSPKGWKYFLVLITNVMLVLTSVSCFIPIRFMYPGTSIDDSWIRGMNDAIHNNLTFGEDIIFTYGPYVLQMTDMYNPGMLKVSLLIGLLTGLTHGWITVRIMARSVFPFRFLWLFIMVMLRLFFFRESLYLSMPLMICIYVLIYCSKEAQHNGRWSRMLEYLCFVWFLGLLPLIKGTALIVTMTAIFCLVLVWLNWRKPLMAALSLLIPVLSTVCLWILADQPIRALPNYFSTIGLVITGYTDAMSTISYEKWVPLYLIFSMAALAGLAFRRSIPWKERVILTAVFALTFFVCFKGIFVRQDHGHLFAYAPAFLHCLLFAGLMSMRPWKWIMMTIAPALFLIFLLKPAEISGWKHVYSSVSNTYGHPLRFVFNHQSLLQDHEQKLDSAWRDIQNQTNWEVYPGTVDVYNFSQVQLLASGNKWNPRPLFTGYFNRSGALLNQQHLVSENAPDHVILSVGSIDNRLPSLEEASAWPWLLNRYSPLHIRGRHLFLRKKADTVRSVLAPDSSTEEHKLGEWVSLQPHTKPVFANMTFRKKWAGKLFDLFYKSPTLEIRFRLKGGEERRHRLIAGMAEVPFLNSPLVENAIDFRNLYDSTLDAKGKIIEAYCVSSPGPWAWDGSYKVVLTPLIRNDRYAWQDSSIVHDQWESFPPSGTLSDTTNTGNIDNLNYQRFQLTDSSILSIDIRGWLAVMEQNVFVPSLNYAMVTDASGQTKYFPLAQDSREDLVRHFKSNDMISAGFKSSLNMLVAKGPVRISLAYISNGQLFHCVKYEKVID